METFEEVVRSHYGSAVEIEGTPFVAFCGWRLSAYGRTIAVAETESAMWADAYQHVAELLDLDEDDDLDDDDLDDEDEEVETAPLSIEQKQQVVTAYYGHRLSLEVPRGDQPFFRASVYGRTIGIGSNDLRMWCEAYDSAVDSAGGQGMLHSLTGVV